MALCFAHASAGYLVYEAVRPAGPHRPALLAGAVALANAPDLDFLPGFLIGQPGMFHRGVSHTIAAVAVVAVLGALAGRWLGRGRGATLRGATWVALAYGSHLLLDFFTTNALPPRGARFLWPFSSHHYIAPITPLPEIVIDPTGRGAFVGSITGPDAFGVWAGDVALLVAVVAAVQVLRLVRPALGGARRGLAEEP